MSLIADVVFASASVAFAHFGVNYEAPAREPAPQVERTVARRKPRIDAPGRTPECPERQALSHRA